MHRFASILVLGLALSAAAADAAEIWRWKDANGTVHYSDSPVPGAERIEVQVIRPATPAGTTPSATPTYSSPPAAAQEPEAVIYTRCAVALPANDATLQAAEPVTVSLAIEPALQAGHRIQVFLNGAAYLDWPDTATSHSLGNLYRGSYTLAVRVLDASGRALCTGALSNFHVRQPSVLSPLRRVTPN